MFIFPCTIPNSDGILYSNNIQDLRFKADSASLKLKLIVTKIYDVVGLGLGA